jgi:DMSO/TMAO reductase YedYZ molybdopterin-dependent catalytic subunit
VFLFVAGTEISLGVPLAHGPFAALLWLAFLIVGWGVALGVSLASPFLGTAPLPTTPQAHLARRTLLKFVAGSLGVTIVAGGVGWLLQLQQRSSRAGQPLAPSGTSSPGPLSTASATPGPAEPAAAETPATTTAEATSRNQVPPAPGTRPEVTSNENFYQVDIDTRPPDIDGGSWALQVSGLFERPRALTLSALRAYPSVTQPITLSCISNPVGGDLISTAYLVGVPLRVVLKDLGLRPEAKALNLKAADGFYESAALEDMQDSRTLLVYGMNGQMLPMGHGFPLRIYIPNRYGMKQPKWIMSMEATDARGPGYWVDRGWSLEAHPQIVSVIDTVAKDKIENSRAPIGGIAWAGDRGIQKVEIQVDDGPWVPTILRTPPLGSLTWIQWRYDWRPTSGTHTFRVRATDGTGALQIPDVRDTYPDGATGYHSVTMTI